MGEEVSDKIQSISVTEQETESAETVEFDEAELAKEMELALDTVRALGKAHQEELIDSICDNFYDLNGIEASTQDIASVFARIKSVFAEEADDDVEDESD